MHKKFICMVCGYVHEGDAAPEKCPICGAPASKFKLMDEEAELQFVTEHEIGVAKGCDEEMIKDLNAARVTRKSQRHSSAMHGKRQNMPPSLPNFSATWFGTQRPTLRSAWPQKPEQTPTRCASQNEPKRSVMMPSMIPYMKWQKTKLATDAASQVSMPAISRSKLQRRH